jgi:hypothetical protein
VECEISVAAPKGAKGRVPDDLVRLRTAIGACLSLALLGCYSPNHPALEKEVRSLVSVGMPVSTAVAHLTAHGFGCSGTPNGQITCARIRQRLLPSSCVERVNLESGNPAAALSRLDIPPIRCAGV